MTTNRRLATLSITLSLLSACGGGGGSDAVAAAPPAPTPPAPTPPAPTPPAPTPPTLPAGWTQRADLPVGLAKFGAAALGGKIYAVGGYDTRRTVYVYDIAADRWDTGPSLSLGTDNLSVVEAGGRLYAIGGEARTALQVLDPATNSWSQAPAAPAIRFASAAAVLGGRVHVAGGWNYSNSASNSIARHDAFEPTTQTWAELAPLTTARNAAGAAVAGGLLYVVGGRSPGIRANDQASLASVEVYTPGSNSWAAGAPLPTARGSLAVVALGGRLYALGGEAATGTVSAAVERFDPATGAWSALAAMPYSSHGLGAVVVGDSIYVIGGFAGASDAVGSESRAVYRYAPGT